jgi:predicted RNase H-like HicB family nuclease
MGHFTATAIFQAEPEGGYTVTVPHLPGVVSYGRTIEEAKKNIYEAVTLHIENLRSHGLPVEVPENSVYTQMLHVEYSE